MANKNRKLAAAFDLPPEVEELPPELAKAGPLTVKQRNKDIRYRDKLMELHGTAARLSVQERDLNHAKISGDLYAKELERLESLRSVSARKRGFSKRELERRIRITANNLADALVVQGEWTEAAVVLVANDPKSKRFDYLAKLRRASDRPDDDHCDCAPENKSVSPVYSPAHGTFVNLVKCACGHMNATAKLPSELVTLHRTRGRVQSSVKPGEPQPKDTAIIKHAQKVHKDG